MTSSCSQARLYQTHKVSCPTTQDRGRGWKLTRLAEARAAATCAIGPTNVRPFRRPIPRVWASRPRYAACALHDLSAADSPVGTKVVVAIRVAAVVVSL